MRTKTKPSAVLVRFLALEHLRAILGSAAMFARSPALRRAGWLPAAITSSAPRRTGGTVGRWDDSTEARRLSDEAHPFLAVGDRLAAADSLVKLSDIQRGAASPQA
ncbi:hypothetical protein [Azohydromonas australica]|uniref:hypothetical protein n=1 Tax=Azohydromonas australica TaxID=364039 RepID=UPI00041CB7AA|nr:hypothetical protein [Azohydromonas australica]